MILEEAFTLANGVAIPKLGLGTWRIDDGEAAQVVREAAAIGYRHFDTAQAYGNERGVGEGLRTSGIAREELFVTTKLVAESKTFADAGARIDGSLTYPTKEDFLRDVIRPFNARMAVGIKPTVRSIIADGDRVVIFFDARGTATDGKPYVNSYAWFFRMRSSRVIEANAFFDAIAFDDLWSRITPP